MDLILSSYYWSENKLGNKKMKGQKFLPYGIQDIDEEDINAVSHALNSDFLTTGPKVKKFEEHFSKFTNAKYTISCSNGTAALHLACLAMGLKEGDWVIVPSITFLATANAIRFCGAEVLFCDVDEKTGLMTPATLKKAISHAKKKNLVVKAVITVHLTGKPVNLRGLKMICDQHDLVLISDSCHALGGVYDRSPIGSCKYEGFNTFSFHPVKAITSGEGGAVTTNTQKHAEKMRIMRSHSMERADSDNNWWTYKMNSLGYNYRMSDIQCALGTRQLKKLERFVAKRESLVELYNIKLKELTPVLTTPVFRDNELVDRVGWHLYSVLIDFDKLKITKESFINKLMKKKIRTQVHYMPVHLQPYYERRYGSVRLPGANSYAYKTLSLPLFTKMEVADLEYVVEQINNIIK